ncbi:MAG: YncE family protein [Myxococcota bacterium]
MKHNSITIVLGLSLGLQACADMAYSTKSEAGYYGDTAAGYAMDDADVAAEAPNDGEFDDGYGSESEDSFLALRPATTDAYVFVANPDRNTVSRISVPSLEVLTTEVGVEPSIVETSADYTRAVTFNKGSDSISIIDADSLDVTEVEVRNNLNQMKMSPDGKWVICYHDVNADDGGTADGGSISFNAISIIDLETSEQVEAIVGAYPHDVQFTEDSALAVIVSDDYLAAVDLTSESVLPKRIAISDDLINPPRAEEVLLDPIGRYAIVRQYGVNELVLVDFSDNAVSEVSMLAVGENPTDMDVSPTGDEAIVVARGSKELWIYDLEDPTNDPIIVPFPEEEVFGSLLLSPGNEQGILYSTASGQSRYGVWDRLTEEVLVRGLVKPVSSVGLSPNGNTGIIFHPQENGDTPSSSQFYNHHALSLVDMGDFFSTSYRLAGEPTAFASTPDGNTGFYVMDGLPFLEIIDYQSFVPAEVRLPSVPVHLGNLPETNTVFVSQEHELGRLSFYNADESQLRTITGFELNSAIEHD